MKINKLKLYNFSSFEGLNEFDFSSTDELKNIILIGGKNGAGKTSLFSAIKLALYGPLAFGYVGVSSHYIRKIKDVINSKAFTQENVLTYVTVELLIMVEREYHSYEITRSWKYEEQRILESYSVIENGHSLDDQEISYFENYLKSIIPPDLFDFFMFDGEAVGEIFSTESYNGYIRNALFTMCGLDTFEDIRRVTSRYISRNDEDTETLTAYEENEKLVSEFKGIVEELREEKALLSDREIALVDEIRDLESAFKNAGGITKEELVSMQREFDAAEKVKAECSLEIKAFVENQMPFVIVSELAAEIDQQLDLEEKADIFEYINFKIDRKEIASILQEYSIINYDVADIMIDYLQKKFKPKGYSDEYVSIHDLSREEKNRVNAMMGMLESFDSARVLDLIERKQQASATTVAINKKLRNAMTEEDRISFERKHEKLLAELSNVRTRLSQIDNEIIEAEGNLDGAEISQKRLYDAIRSNAQNKHVYELSQGVADVMELLLAAKTVSLREKLEAETVKKLHKLYRKDNLITHIEIADNYKFSLYQDQDYSGEELSNLMQNLGIKAFAEQIGMAGIHALIKDLEVPDLVAVREKLKLTAVSKTYHLYKKIELSRLSKGERQIFILALYWAMIELSGQEIPFVIDTPYARIDATHRKEISEKFFPSISKQVIILSTDEEINEEYYRIVKPYVSKEYLLSNDMAENHTSVSNRYFFGENVL